jgi:phosphomannomutase
LTGFKYIGEKIHIWENEKDGYQFLFGAEESYGYLIGTHSRDKDAIVSCCLISEMALLAKLQNATLVDRLYDLYKKFGVFREKLLSIDFNPGKEGMDKMSSLMSKLRANPPKTILGKKILILEDYKEGYRTYLDTGKKEKLTLPSSNVLLYRLEDETKAVIRPSGTEPKIKVYAGVRQKDFSSVEKAIAECDEKLDLVLSAIKKDLLA